MAEGEVGGQTKSCSREDAIEGCGFQILVALQSWIGRYQRRYSKLKVAGLGLDLGETIGQGG